MNKKQETIKKLQKELAYYRHLLSICSENDELAVEGCLYEIRKIKKEIASLRKITICSILF